MGLTSCWLPFLEDAPMSTNSNGSDYMTDKEIREAVRWLDALDQQ